jgi:uncharacterized protein involved in response to NO|tara:strand:- start:41604 stop:41810 length:207 start_codon:yes stop_codon:yes gene_type:complete
MEPPRYLSIAFGLVFIAAVLRATLPLLDVTFTLWAWRLSALLLIVAFSLFLMRYVPVLMQSRVDGKPG